MAEQNKLTIYQQLNKVLNLDGFGFQDGISTSQQSVASSPKENR